MAGCFLLVFLLFMGTSGLPPGNTGPRYMIGDGGPPSNGSGFERIQDLETTTTGIYPSNLTFTNESSLEVVGLDGEKEHLKSTHEYEPPPPNLNHSTISNRSNTTTTPGLGTSNSSSASDSNEEDENFSNETNEKHEEIPPMHALHQNYTKVPLRGNCNNTYHCMGEFVVCSAGVCKCREGYGLRPDNRDQCGERVEYNIEMPQTDPTMIGVVVGLILMSVTLCVVLRLFAKARFRENRSIFNTPNPRLMNVSLMKGSKQLFRGNSGNASRSRRGSQVSLQSTTEAPTTRSPNSPKNENGVGIGSTPRPKVSRQMSTEVGSTPAGVQTPEVNRPSSGGVNNKYKYRQDSVASNV